MLEINDVVIDVITVMMTSWRDASESSYSSSDGGWVVGACRGTSSSHEPAGRPRRPRQRLQPTQPAAADQRTDAVNTALTKPITTRSAAARASAATVWDGHEESLLYVTQRRR